MSTLKYLVPLTATLFAAAALSASQAGSSASSATSAASDSVGASSDSIKTSSNSSSKNKTAAAGDYKVLAVADAEARAPGATARSQLTLRAIDDDNEFVLVLPKAVVEQTGLVVGATVSARQRPYGLEFTAGQAKQAFFLVLADDWHRELHSTAVVL